MQIKIINTEGQSAQWKTSGKPEQLSRVVATVPGSYGSVEATQLAQFLNRWMAQNLIAIVVE